MACVKLLEKDIKRQIIQWLFMQKNCFAWINTSVGVFDAKKKTYRRTIGVGRINGTSDILGIWQRRFLAIEVKRPGGKLTHDQIVFLERVRENGGIAFTAYSLDDVIKNLSQPVF